jgi:hypothetical protein
MVLTIGEFFVSDGTEAWDNCVGGFSNVLANFGNWDRDAATVTDKGVWHLFDDCYGTDNNTVGIAVEAVACENRAGSVDDRAYANLNVGITSYGGTFQPHSATMMIVAFHSTYLCASKWLGHDPH